MVNYACGFNQSETEKHFKWIINIGYGPSLFGQDGWILPVLFLRVYGPRVEVHKHAKKKLGQYPAILTEQPWSIKGLIILGKFLLRGMAGSPKRRTIVYFPSGEFVCRLNDRLERERESEKRKRRINYLSIHVGVTAVRVGTYAWPFILRDVRLHENRWEFEFIGLCMGSKIALIYNAKNFEIPTFFM